MGKSNEKITISKSPVPMSKSPKVKKKDADKNNNKVKGADRTAQSSTPSCGTDETVAATTQAELGNFLFRHIFSTYKVYKRTLYAVLHPSLEIVIMIVIVLHIVEANCSAI